MKMTAAIRGIALCFALVQHAASASSTTPESTAVEFYRWYIKTLTLNEEPTEAERTMLRYVTKPLWRSVKKEQLTDNSGSDYFIKAQDYYDDWLDAISTTAARQEGGRAALFVTLGATAESTHRLAVDLLKERGTWKIHRVRRVCAGQPEEADEPCVANPD